MTHHNASRGPLRSSIITQGVDRATHRSLFYSMGHCREDLNKHHLIRPDCMTATGKTIAENIAGRKIRDPEVIHPVENPISLRGGLAILHGNLAPEGAVVKSAAVAPEMMVHSGPARVFDREEEALEAIFNGSIRTGDEGFHPGVDQGGGL